MDRIRAKFWIDIMVGNVLVEVEIYRSPMYDYRITGIVDDVENQVEIGMLTDQDREEIEAKVQKIITGEIALVEEV